jgi:hypothetical protein
MSANDVLEQALGLSDIERLNLAERLMDSVDHESSTDDEFDLAPSYSVELQRRLDEMARSVGVNPDAWESLERLRRELDGTPTASNCSFGTSPKRKSRSSPARLAKRGRDTVVVFWRHLRKHTARSKSFPSVARVGNLVAAVATCGVPFCEKSKL